MMILTIPVRCLFLYILPFFFLPYLFSLYKCMSLISFIFFLFFSWPFSSVVNTDIVIISIVMILCYYWYHDLYDYDTITLPDICIVHTIIILLHTHDYVSLSVIVINIITLHHRLTEIDLSYYYHYCLFS